VGFIGFYFLSFLTPQLLISRLTGGLGLLSWEICGKNLRATDFATAAEMLPHAGLSAERDFPNRQVPASVCKPAFVREGRICRIGTCVFRHESSDDSMKLVPLSKTNSGSPAFGRASR